MMKLNIKTLQQTSFTIEVESTETVSQLKEKIQALEKAPEPARQKLIHTGRILANEKTVAEYAIKDGDSLVLMITPAPSAVKQTTAAVGSKLAVNAPTSSPRVSAPVSPAAATTAAPQTQEALGGANALLTGEALEEAVKNIMEMGFPDRGLVEKALLLAFNNPNRAVELLSSGQIEAMLEELEDEEDEGGEEEGDDIEGDEEHEDTENGPNPLDFLRNDPQFQQMRTLIQQNPQLLPPLIEQLRHSNPDIFALISANSEAFVRLMQEGLSPEDVEASLDPNASTPASLPPNVIRVSEEERQAIERLEQLGFDRARAIEAFFACDKNEELAANFLLEHLDD